MQVEGATKSEYEFWQLNIHLDRVLLQTLYEDWLASNGDWYKSATYCNACEKSQSTKRGTFVYKSFKDLKDSFGEAVAKDIRTRKYEAEKTRKPDEEPFHKQHPEVPDSEDR